MMTRRFSRMTIVLSFCCQVAVAQVPIEPIENIYTAYTPVAMRYWFDLDYASVTERPYASGRTGIDINHLRPGFHTIHLQVIDNHGATSPVRFSTFFIPERSIEPLFTAYTPVAMRYWFDLDYASVTERPYASGQTAIDINHLRAGFHTIHLQVIDNHGATSPVRFSTFFIPERNMEDINGAYSISRVRYWTDGDASTMQTIDYTDGVQAIDLSYLAEGVHTLYYQLITKDGEVSPVRTTTIERCSLYDIYVSFPTEYNAGTVSSNPLFAAKPDLRLNYDAANTRVRGQLTVDEGTTLRLGKYVQAAHWGNSSDADRFSRAGEAYYHPTTLVNQGRMEADSVVVEQTLYRDRWHFLSLPFNVSVSNIGGPESTYWVVRAYDGDARAAGLLSNTWTTLRNGEQMKAGEGYIVQLTCEGDAPAAALTFKTRNDQQKSALFASADVTTQLESHPAELAQNRDWNLVGNPYPAFYDTRHASIGSPIIVWNGSGYDAYSPLDDSYVLMPFEAFFIQKPAGTSTLTFGKDGRQHTADLGAGPVPARKQSKALLNRHILNFTLTDIGLAQGLPLQGTNETADRTRVVINEQASVAYEQDKDAPKFMAAEPQSPLLMTLDGGVQYAINERPLADGLITFSVYAPEDGTYRFAVGGNAIPADAPTRSLSERYDDMTVLDTETGEIWPLSDGDYVFTAHAGMNAARLVVSLTGEASAIEQVRTYDDGELHVSDGHLSLRFARAKHLRVYGIDGRQLYNAVTTAASIHLRSGIYVVEINGKATKMMIK